MQRQEQPFVALRHRGRMAQVHRQGEPVQVGDGAIVHVGRHVVGGNQGTGLPDQQAGLHAHRPLQGGTDHGLVGAAELDTGRASNGDGRLLMRMST